jgi:MFS family permease
MIMNMTAYQKAASSTWALTSLALSMLLSSLGVSIANIALPALTIAFEAPYQNIQWVVLSYLLAITTMIVSIGRLGDMLGLRRVLLSGIALFTFASALCVIAPSLWFLIAARALQGLGAAALMAVTVALVRDIVPKERTGSAMGLLGTMSAIGTALGPTAGGFLLWGFGWRAIFLVMLPLGSLIYFLAHRFLPAEKFNLKTARVGFDLAGTFTLAIALAAYALSMTISDKPFDNTSCAIIVTTVVATGIFILIEMRTEFPLLKLSAFRNLVLSCSLVMNGIVATVMMATLIIGPFFLSISLGLVPVMVGLAMSVGPAISTLTGIPAGHTVDRFGASRVAVVGLTLMTLGAFALSQLPMIYGLAGYIMAMTVLTPGYQLFQAANNTSVMMDVSSDQRGVISAMLSLSRNLGLITGASVMGAIFAFASGTSDIKIARPDALAEGMRVTFLVATALLAAAIIISLCTKSGSKNSSRP